MLSDFSKTFGRNFIVAYFMPSVLFITVSIFLFSNFFQKEVNKAEELFKEFQSIWNFLLFLFVAWLLCIILMALNRGLIRLLEGYHILKYTPLLAHQQKLFDDLGAEISRTVDIYNDEFEKYGAATKETEDLYQGLLLKRRGLFPASREQVMATAFGNIMRTSENYSHKVYGVDAISAWPRIIALIPNDYLNAIDQAKSQLNFCVNTIYLAIILVLQYLCYALITRTWPFIWIPISCLVVAIVVYRFFALSAAKQWGGFVRAVFDLFREDLIAKLGLEIPTTWEKERQIWVQLNRMFLYWDSPEELVRKKIRGKKMNND